MEKRNSDEEGPRPADTELDEPPAGWEAAWDPEQERFYYFNRTTQQRVWKLEAIGHQSQASKAGSDPADRNDGASRNETKRKNFRDLVQMQARTTKELQNISHTMAAVCAEMRRMRQGDSSPSRPVSSSQLSWAQRRHNFHKRRNSEELKQLFAEVGKLDPESSYTYDEVGACFADPRIPHFFEEQLHLNVRFADEVFQLIDTDGDGRVPLMDFMEGCVELKDEPSVQEEFSRTLSIQMAESLHTMSASLNRAYPDPEDEIRPIHPYDLRNLPEVEVAIRVNNLANVDTNLLKFEADFTVYLDWVDDRIPDGVTEMQLDWDNIFFNPSIVVENMEEDPQEPPCCSSTPQFKRPEKSASPRLQQQQNEWLTRNGRQCKWVSKAYRFRGVLSMPEVDLSCFPFDYQMLPLKVRTNRITFGDINNAFVRFASSASSAPRVRRLCRQYNSREAKFRHQGSYCASSPSDTCTADSMVEFKIFGLFSFPARSLLDARGEAHQVTVVVKRPVVGHNLGDLVVLISLTLLSCVSFWDSAPELSSRMSITLTLILTVAAYTSQRPAAIEKVPYSTLQDQSEL
jgi:hypothetical protein